MSDPVRAEIDLQRLYADLGRIEMEIQSVLPNPITSNEADSEWAQVSLEAIGTKVRKMLAELDAYADVAGLTLQRPMAALTPRALRMALSGGKVPVDA